MSLTVGSLFAGVGGFDIAAERAGMEVLWQSEFDKHASRVLDYRWPDVKNYGDIHEIRGTGVAGVDVLCGGFPCQDYSVAGTGSGLAGDRGALWWEYHRLITELSPTWIVGENVPGLLSSNGGRDFETIVGSLTECGYGVAWAVLDAQYFGVAQRRRRVFIVGHSGGDPRPEILALGEGVFGHPQPSRTTRQAIAPTLAARTRGGGGLGTDFDLDGGLIAFAQNQRDEVRDLGDLAAALGAEHGMKQQSYIAFPWQASWDAAQDDGTTPTLPSNQTLAVIQDTRPMAKGQNGAGVSDDDISMMAWDAFNQEMTGDLAHTLRSGGSGDSIPHYGVRRLTPLECERLQGFPRGWTDVPGNSDSQRYRQLGNAVAVPVVEWIMRRIAAHS